MARRDSRKVLAEHVKRLSPKKPDGSVNVTQLALKLGRGKANVGAAQRVLSGETSVGLELLDMVADAFGADPADLLRPLPAPKPSVVVTDPTTGSGGMLLAATDFLASLSEQERDVVLAFRALPASERNELADQLMADAERYRAYAQQVLAEYGVKGVASNERVAAHLPPAPRTAPTKPRRAVKKP